MKHILVGAALLGCVLVALQGNRVTAQVGETLRSAADAQRMYIGAAVSPNFYDTTEPEYGQVLAREYNMLVAENIMKWSALQNSRYSYSFTGADGMVAFAQKHKQAVRGHTLVWHESLPTWVLRINNKNELQNVLKEHVQTVAKHFKGKVFAWDALNEAILEDGSYRKTLFYNLLGQEYIANVFKWAHEADPKTKLFYNDYNTEGINPKSDAVYALVKSLLAKGVPIHGVGFQTHVDASFSSATSSMPANLERFRALGLEVQMTEVDVKTVGSGTQAEKLALQAKVYGDLVRTCLSVKCSAFITWGFTDAYSWRASSQPLPFDSNYAPKPAYYAILEALRNPVVAAPMATPPVVTVAAPVSLEPSVFADFAVANPQFRIAKTEYSQFPKDAVVDSLRVDAGLLVVDYRLSKIGGSTYAGAGANLTLLDGKTVDASGYSALRLNLASSAARTLRVRIAGPDQGVLDSGCYPIATVNVTTDFKTYTLPFKDFATPSYCQAGGRDIAQTLPAVVMLEVADDGLPDAGTRAGRLQIGAMTFVKP